MTAFSNLPENVRTAVVNWPFLDEEEKESYAEAAMEEVFDLLEVMHEAYKGRAGSQNRGSTIQADLTVQE